MLPGIIKLAADLALDVYSDDTGYPGFAKKTYIDDEADVFLRIYEDDSSIYIVTRGTDSVQDWMQNIWVEKDWFEGVKVHSGFCREAGAVLHVIRDYLAVRRSLTNQKVLYFIGHSAGGAVSVLFGLVFLEWRPRIITFGQPRVSDTKSIQRRIKDHDYVRVADCMDTVTRVPKVGYSHAGTLYYIDTSGDISPDPGMWKRFRERTFRLDQWRRATEHSMKRYREDIHAFYE